MRSPTNPKLNAPTNWPTNAELAIVAPILKSTWNVATIMVSAAAMLSESKASKSVPMPSVAAMRRW